MMIVNKTHTSVTYCTNKKSLVELKAHKGMRKSEKYFKKYKGNHYTREKILLCYCNYESSKYDGASYGEDQTISFHLDELKDRIILSFLTLLFSIIISLNFSKEIILAFEVNGLKNNFSFLQLNPGEYFFTSIEASIYFGTLISVPSIVYHIGSYLNPGLSNKEKKFIIPTALGSIFLFLLGLLFSYYILSPFALKFFSDFSINSVESTLSIKEYFDFYIKIMISTGIGFQVPVIQLILTQLKIVTSQQMASKWRIIIVLSSIIAAIITPTTDPVTQLATCLPLIGLYFCGILVSRYFE
mmetsp:Transcript_13442/g.32974  ORF Transcript_13442/g.32974 Transcript_13442/m.32974 type:complete len:299 (-) Transcript_13442:232-1128(-)